MEWQLRTSGENNRINLDDSDEYKSVEDDEDQAQKHAASRERNNI